jgi:SAM-dependent methyltransferase
LDRGHGALGSLLIKTKVDHLGGRTVDLELEAGARAHFDDPLYYSSTYVHVEDANYYRDLAKRLGKKRVLELGIGNGRIALPMARAGIEVTGIDHSAPMLDNLRSLLAVEKPSVRDRVRLVEGDMRTTKLKLSTGEKKFDLVICPFNAALHMYRRQDVEAWLARIREHLDPREGTFVFDISMPIPKDLARNPTVPYRIPPFDHPTAGRVGYREHFEYDGVRQILFVSMFFEPIKRKGSSASAKNDTREEFMTPLAHRQFFPQEMEALLHYNGFEVTALFGDWKEGPLVPGSDIMIWHTKPTRRAKTTTKKKKKKTKKA